MPPLLEARNLTKRYSGAIALDGVSVEVSAALPDFWGPNGAGKSTAIKLFLGLLTPTEGARAGDGRKPHRERRDSRPTWATCPEHDCIPSNMTATEFLAHMAQISGLPPSAARGRARRDTLRHVGLDEERYRSIGEYSTGMIQRVKLAQALAARDPSVVFLDEPTAGLDPRGPRGDARADTAHRARVRNQHSSFDSPDGRRGDDLRQDHSLGRRARFGVWRGRRIYGGERDDLHRRGHRSGRADRGADIARAVGVPWTASPWQCETWETPNTITSATRWRKWARACAGWDRAAAG